MDALGLAWVLVAVAALAAVVCLVRLRREVARAAQLAREVDRLEAENRDARQQREKRAETQRRRSDVARKSKALFFLGPSTGVMSNPRGDGQVGPYWRTSLPAVVIASNEVGELRYATLIQRREAKKKPIKVWGAEDIGLEGAPRKRLELKRLFVPEMRKRRCQFVDGETSAEAGRRLAQRLQIDGVLSK